MVGSPTSRSTCGSVRVPILVGLERQVVEEAMISHESGVFASMRSRVCPSQITVKASRTLESRSASSRRANPVFWAWPAPGRDRTSGAVGLMRVSCGEEWARCAVAARVPYAHMTTNDIAKSRQPMTSSIHERTRVVRAG